MTRIPTAHLHLTPTEPRLRPGLGVRDRITAPARAPFSAHTSTTAPGIAFDLVLAIAPALALALALAPVPGPALVSDSALSTAQFLVWVSAPDTAAALVPFQDTLQKAPAQVFLHPARVLILRSRVLLRKVSGRDKLPALSIDPRLGHGSSPCLPVSLEVSPDTIPLPSIPPGPNPHRLRTIAKANLRPKTILPLAWAQNPATNQDPVQTLVPGIIPGLALNTTSLQLLSKPTTYPNQSTTAPRRAAGRANTPTPTPSLYFGLTQSPAQSI